MKVIDPGHTYELLCIDGSITQTLRFVKREGTGYPGNVGTQPGTTLQDVIHCLIDRTRYLDGQIHCIQDDMIVTKLQECLYLLEERAAKRHGMEFQPSSLIELESKPLCPVCGHTQCHH